MAAVFTDVIDGELSGRIVHADEQAAAFPAAPRTGEAHADRAARARSTRVVLHHRIK
jgi:hypothetical protein